MKQQLRPWLIGAFGATMALPFNLPTPSSHGAVVPLDALLWPLLVAALLWAGPREWNALRHDVVARLLVAFLVVTAASVPFGIFIYHSTEGVRSFAYQVLIVANFAAGYMVLRDLDDLRLLVKGFVGSIGAFALILDGYLLQSGVLKSVHSFHNSRLISGLIYGWPNAFSVLLVVGLILAVYLMLTAGATASRRIYGVLIAGLAIAEVLTFSKTGWVALAAAMWLMSLRYWTWRDQAYVVCALLAGGIILFFVSNNSFRTQVFTLETLTERVQITADVFRYVNPLVFIAGSGSQSLETLLAQTHAELVPGLPLSTLSPHDEFMNVLVKGGIVSLALFVAALVVVTLRARRLAMTGGVSSNFFRYWYATVAAILVSLLAGEELHYWPVAAIFWLVAGFAFRVQLTAKATTSVPPERSSISDPVAGSRQREPVG